MDIAEDEIAAGKLRYPLQADLINDSFRYLVPTECVHTDTLFRAHAREIVDRVAKGDDVRPGTTAEVIGAISKLTVVAPPSRELTLLYMKLFSQLFPHHAHQVLEETGPIEPDGYERQRMDELEAELRRKLTTDRDVR